MNRVSPTNPFTSLIPEELSKEYNKVRKVLDLYAGHRHTLLKDLRLIDVCDYNGALTKELQRFINRLPTSPKQTEDNAKAYKQQAASRIKRIVKRILEGKSTKPIRRTYPVDKLPPFLIPVLSKFPMVRGSRAAKYKGCENVTDDLVSARKIVAALSDHGRDLLTVLQEVTDEHDLSTVRSLMYDHAQDVINTIRKICPRKKWVGINIGFRNLRRALGIPPIPQKKRFLDFDKWPPTLREQVDVFLERSVRGLEADEVLGPLAAAHNIQVGKLTDNTRRNYLKAIGYFLSVVPWKKDLDVSDLLVLKAVRRKVRANCFTQVMHNRLVDIFRTHERNLCTDRSRKGYDSNTFNHFKLAIKSVAAFNGIFELQKPFTKAYVQNLDTDRKREIKAWKKRVFSLKWIDQEIERLSPEYYRVIKSRSFWFESTSITREERRKTLMLCTFFVTLMTLRYMGYRQECIRNCIVGKNIIFDRDGTITFRWAATETKTKKVINIRLNKSKHGETHGALIDALHAYYKHIYPFLDRLADRSSKGHFFLRFLRCRRVARHRDEASFGEQFEMWTKEFLELDQLDNPDKRNINPHHLRGLCTDWLVYDCGLSLNEVAVFIGDTVAVLEHEYLDRNQPLDVTPILDKLNKNLKADRDAEKYVELQTSLAQSQRTILEKDRQMNVIIEQLEFSRESLKKAEAKIETQAAETAALHREIASLREKEDRTLCEAPKSSNPSIRDIPESCCINFSAEDG